MLQFPYSPDAQMGTVANIQLINVLNGYLIID